ncbi:MAG TPA: hypothetical protein VIJ93_12845 [bacterium]
MKREEFFLGVSLYALVIAAGFSGPILKKLGKLSWDKPIGSFVWGYSRPPVLFSNQKATKGTLASRTWKILKKGIRESEPDLTKNAIRQKLEEDWKKMASHQAVIGTEPNPNPIPLLGKKKDMKLAPDTPERKVPNGEEPTKG